MNIKTIIKNNKHLSHFMKQMKVLLSKKNNKLIKEKAHIVNCEFNISGINNTIIIEAGSTLKDCTFKIYGDNNLIKINTDCSLHSATFWIEDNNNQITIGKNTTIRGKTSIACIESTKITIGNDCMFSSNISLRTGDSHSILDSDSRIRINPSKDILIGDHVWVGTEVMISKGVHIPNNSIVGMCSLVTKKFETDNIIIAGSPAKVIKHGIDWSRERL